MKTSRRRLNDQSALDLAEETLRLLRRVSGGTLAAYYLGGVPFILGLLYFWAEMSGGAFAWSNCAGGSLILALLFVWMKAWQAVYARRLRAEVAGVPAPALNGRAVARLITTQAVVHAAGLFLIPVMLLMTFPFGWAHAFFQSATCLTPGDQEPLRTFLRRVGRQAALWPVQNHILIWLFSPWLLILVTAFTLVLIPIISAFNRDFAGVLIGLAPLGLLGLLACSPLAVAAALNIGIVLAVIPEILNALFGLESVFTLSGAHLLNTTFLVAVIGLTYLVLDPLNKAACVLRCFHGDSLKTGEDLTVKLQRFARPARQALVALLLLLSLPLSLPALPAHRSLGEGGSHVEGSPAPAPRNSGQAVNPVEQVSPPADDAPRPLGAGHPTEVSAGGPGALAVRSAPAEEALPARSATLSVADGRAASAPASPTSWQDLNDSIEKVKRRREYTWRMPREPEPQGKPRSFFFRIMDDTAAAIKRWTEPLRDFLVKARRKWNEWMRKFFQRFRSEPESPEGGGADWQFWIMVFQCVLLAATAALLGVFALRIWRQRRYYRRPQTPVQPVPSRADLTDESVAPTQWPEEDWLRLARELTEKGEYRLALRAGYLAILACLGRTEWLAISRGKSNFEYRVELRRRARDRTDMLRAFEDNVIAFDRAWYGLKEVTAETLDQFNANRERIHNSVAL